MMRFKVTPIVGLPQFTGWSQIAENNLQYHTSFFSAFAIAGKNAGSVGRAVSDQINNYRYKNLQELHDFLLELVDLVQSEQCSLQIAGLLVSEDKSICFTKNGTVFLHRGEKSGVILESEELMMLQGKFDKNDLFILGTKPAQDFLSEIKIKLTQGYETDVIITSIVPSLHAQADSSLSALLFLQYDENFSSSYSNESLHDEDANSNSYIDQQSLSDTHVTASNNDQNNSEPELEIQLDLQKINKSFNKEQILSFVAHKSSVWADRFKKMFIKAKYLNQKIKERLAAKDTDLKSQNQISNESYGSYDNNEIYFENKTFSWKNKLKFALLGMFVLIFTIMIIRYFYLDNQASKQVEAEIVSIRSSFEEVKNNFAQNPIVGRTELKKTITNLEQKEKQFADNKYVAQFIDLKKEVESYLVANSGVSDLINLPTFYDARLVKSNFLIQDMAVSKNKLLLLDKEQKNLLVVDLKTKEVKSKELKEIVNIKDLTAQNNTVYLLAEGLKSLDLSDDFGNETELKNLKEEGDSNRNATVLSAYDNYLYVINPEKRNIYRYVKNTDDDGYSDPIGWIKSATGLDYSQVSSVSIDGDMWLTTADGKLKKFASGRDSNLQITGLENEFSTMLMQYSDAQTKNIYILEADKERIVILDKDGNFVKEIHAPELKTATHIVASEAMGKILVSSGALVFEIVL